MKRTAVAMLGLLLVLGAACSGAGSKEGIEVTAAGRAPVTYDVLEFSISTEYRSAAKDAAATGATRAMDAVVAAFRAKGVAAKDLETGKASTSPVVGASYISGTVATTVRIRSLAAATDTVRAALDAGKAADATVRWSRVYLKVADSSDEEKTAHQSALDDAKRQAAERAGSASRRIGKVLSIKTVSRPAQPPKGYATSLLVEKDLPGLAPFIASAQGKTAVFTTLNVRYELT